MNPPDIDYNAKTDLPPKDEFESASEVLDWMEEKGRLSISWPAHRGGVALFPWRVSEAKYLMLGNGLAVVTLSNLENGNILVPVVCIVIFLIGLVASTVALSKGLRCKAGLDRCEEFFIEVDRLWKKLDTIGAQEKDDLEPLADKIYEHAEGIRRITDWILTELTALDEVMIKMNRAQSVGTRSFVLGIGIIVVVNSPSILQEIRELAHIVLQILGY